MHSYPLMSQTPCIRIELVLKFEYVDSLNIDILCIFPQEEGDKTINLVYDDNLVSRQFPATPETLYSVEVRTQFLKC